MGMMKEFKEFAMKGNLVDMAIAFVMGGAFGKVTTSFIEGCVMPVVGLLTGGVDFSKKEFIIKEATKDAAGKDIAAVAIKYGAFLTTVIDFIVVAFVMFLIIKGINRMKKKEEAAPVAPPAPTATETLLAEIRDALKK